MASALRCWALLVISLHLHFSTSHNHHVASAYSILTIIDGENVRGKSNFNLRHEELVDAVGWWTQSHGSSPSSSPTRRPANNYHYATLVIDHGAKPSAFLQPLPVPIEEEAGGDENLFAILFAGPNEKADDVIARDVGRIASTAAGTTRSSRSTRSTSSESKLELDVLRVVTSDQGLRSRCRIAFEDALLGNSLNDGRKEKRQRSNNGNRKNRHHHNRQSSSAAVRLEFVPSVGFLSQLERELAKHTHTHNQTPPYQSLPSYERMVQALHEDIELRGKLYQVECSLRDAKKSSTAEKRRILIDQGQKLSEKLINLCNLEGQTILDRVVSTADENADDVLSSWDISRREAGRAELTGDRMLLAEHMRRRLLEKRLLPCNNNLQKVPDPATFHCMCHYNFHNAEAAQQLNNPFSISAFDAAVERLRLVIVSDITESRSLRNEPLPEGDVLLHLGNFTPDGPDKSNRKEAIEQFDAWLSDQPHLIKIVLRGSRDAPDGKIAFSSPKMYIDVPRTISFGGGNFLLTLVPHCTDRVLSSSWRRLPHTFDALASHDAPTFIRRGHTSTGETTPQQCNEQQKMLADKVENMFSGPPRVWFGGNVALGYDTFETTLATPMRAATVVCGNEYSTTNEQQEKNRPPLVIDLQKRLTSGLKTKVIENVDLMRSQAHKDLPMIQDYIHDMY